MQTIASIINPTRSALGAVEARVCVAAAVGHMNRLGVDTLLVVNRDGCLLGLLTESDILQGVVAAELDPATVTVGEVMTRQLPTISPNASPEQAMERMVAGCHRELVVLEGSEILGLVSIEEVSRALVRDRDAVIGDLTYYITH